MKRPARQETEGLIEPDRFLEAPHPRLATELCGQDAAEKALLNAYRSGRMHHAWIIAGRPGIGKATLAYRFARFLAAFPDPASSDVANASDLTVPADNARARQVTADAYPDLCVVRRSSRDDGKAYSGEIRVSDVRRVTHLFGSTAAAGGWRIAIIDCLDDMNINAANALLKVLEEPPRRAVFLIISHAPGSALPTIRSRCRTLMLRPLAADVISRITGRMEPWSAMRESLHAEAAEGADGSIHNALKLLDEDTIAFRRKIHSVLDALPNAGSQAVQELANAVDGRGGAERMEVLKHTLEDFLSARLHGAAGQTLEGQRLAPLAEVWEKLQLSAREVEVFNLDRRPLVIMLFASLSGAIKAQETA
jgi:DNA polymerase III subunit delta'